MVTVPKHIDGGVLNLGLTDIPDAVGVQDNLLVATSDHCAAFMVLCGATHSLVCNLVCKLEVSRTL